MEKIFNLEPFGPAPNQRQMAWYRRGKTAFLHFSVNTFTDLEWGDGREDPAVFAPTALDCRQWARVLRDAGFTAAILTAKHHDGFCLWPSRYTSHNVTNSGCKTDVVRLFVDACREFGLRPGVYISPWDRNHPAWGTENYNDVFAGQLTELMTGYGSLCECWWDGAGSTEAKYDWDRWAKIVREYQPDCILFGSLGAAEYVDARWVGNESGIAGESCYGTIDPVSLKVENTDELNTGKPDGSRFIPAEADMSIRPGWFYHESQDNQVKTPEELTDYWFRSAGRNTAILLNIPPDRRGLIPDRDARSILEWDRKMKEIFRDNLAEKGRIFAEEDPSNLVENLLSRDENLIYAAKTTSPQITVLFPEETTFHVFRLEEVIELGHRVRGFRLEALHNGSWREIHRGGCIGFCQSRRLPPVTASGVRLTVTDAPANPVLRFFGVYRAPEEGERKASPASFTVQKVRREGDALLLNLGGIYPYDTVLWDDPGVTGVRVEAFDGVFFRTVWEGRFSGQARFPTVTGSYQLKITVTEGRPREGSTPEVRLSAEK